MARSRRREARSREELPPPLPPETRTVGQLVAETLRLYGRRPWRALALGLGLAVLNQISVSTSGLVQIVLVATIGALLLSPAYAAASAMAASAPVTRRRFLTAVAVGVLAFVPAPFFAVVYVFPAVAWLAFVGLAVPAAIVERTDFRASFARGVALARADYVHAFGSLATLAIVYYLSRTVMLFLLRGQADAAVQVAAFLADLVVSPILVLGAALLYFDQAARVDRPRVRERRRPFGRRPNGGRRSAPEHR